MPLPTLSDVHINTALTNMSVAYVQDAKAYIAGRMFPILPVKKSSDSYFTFGKADFFRDDARRRVPGSESAGFGYTLSSSSYSCDVWAVHYDLADKIRANFDSPLNADMAAVAFLTQKLLVRRDRQFVTDYLGTSIWGSDVAGVASSPSLATQHIFWDNASADIIGDVHRWCDAIEEKTGHRANKMAVGADVWRVMKNDADIVDRIKYTSGEPLSEQIVAKLLGIDELLVISSTYNTAAENATATMDFIAGDVALLTYSAPSPSLMLPSAGYTFSWSDFDLSAGGAAIKNFRMEHLQADRYEGEMAFDFGVVASDCGVYFSDLLT